MFSGKRLKDVFPASSPMSETGAMVEFKEPSEMGGKFRWQIIRILSEAGSEGRKSELTERDGGIRLESRDSSRPTSNTQREEEEEEEGEKEGEEGGESRENQQEQAEMVYGRGMYPNPDASLKDLRNLFIDSGQLEGKGEEHHFQFLKSDVPGDRIELDTEDEVLLSQIEDNLLQRRTMYIEFIDQCELKLL